MENLKLIFGKKIISLSQGEMVGYVLDICTSRDLKMLEGFLAIDEESEEELFLPIDKIQSQNEDCVFIENSKDMELYFGGQSYNPFGKIVYDRKGICLGKVIDLVLNGNKIDKLITEKGEIKQKYIYSNGDDCIIFSSNKKKVIKKEEIIENKINVVNLPKIEIMGSGDKNKENKKITAPARIVTTVSMLVNKTAICDVFGLNNELIIKKGEIINKKIIEKAKKHNKINFLIFNSK